MGVRLLLIATHVTATGLTQMGARNRSQASTSIRERKNRIQTANRIRAMGKGKYFYTPYETSHGLASPWPFFSHTLKNRLITAWDRSAVGPLATIPPFCMA